MTSADVVIICPSLLCSFFFAKSTARVQTPIGSLLFGMVMKPDKWVFFCTLGIQTAHRNEKNGFMEPKWTYAFWWPFPRLFFLGGHELKLKFIPNPHPILATKKKTALTYFPLKYCFLLIGILISCFMKKSLYNWAVCHPLYNPNNQGPLFHVLL